MTIWATPSEARKKFCAETQRGASDHCREPIAVAARGGGFLLDIGAVMPHGKKENLWALTESVRTYGVHKPRCSLPMSTRLGNVRAMPAAIY